MLNSVHFGGCGGVWAAMLPNLGQLLDLGDVMANNLGASRFYSRALLNPLPAFLSASDALPVLFFSLLAFAKANVLMCDQHPVGEYEIR